MRKRSTGKDTSQDSSNEPAPVIPLAFEVREALRAVLHDEGAAAAAKASASRTLLEWFAAEKAGPQKPLAEWTTAELDAEIERVSRLTALRE